MNKILDCLLVNPPDDFSRYPYLGLCYLAGSLKNRGISVEILDSAALGLSIKDATDYIVSKRPKIIGISIMSMRLPFSYKLIQSIKTNCPESTIVVGGAHINADCEILSDMNIRYGFHGECEMSFPDFCESILNNQKPSNIAGLIVNENGNIIAQEPAIVTDLNVLPAPAYDLLPINRYYSPSTHLKTISMITSRGCPFKCIFCSKLQQTRYRYLNSGTVIKQIKALVDAHGIQWVEFVDEIFTINRARIIDLCEKILESKLNIQWGCGTRADKIDDELLRIMRQSGCRKISFGVETGSERVRFLADKKITNNQYIEAIELCRKHKFITTSCFIFGHPTESINEMKQTVKFALNLRTSFVIFTKMVPIPNSELFEQAIKSKSVPPDIWKSFMLGESSYPIYYPKGIDPKDMDRIYTLAWIKYYLSLGKILSNLHILLTPSFFLKSIRVFYDLVSGKKYKNTNM